jgi:hypothetical protein
MGMFPPTFTAITAAMIPFDRGGGCIWLGVFGNIT